MNSYFSILAELSMLLRERMKLIGCFLSHDRCACGILKSWDVFISMWHRRARKKQACHTAYVCGCKGRWGQKAETVWLEVHVCREMFKLTEVPLQVIWAVGFVANSIFLCFEVSVIVLCCLFLFFLLWNITLKSSLVGGMSLINTSKWKLPCSTEPS